MQYRLSGFCRAEIGIAAIENQPEGFAAVRLLYVVQVFDIERKTTRRVPCRAAPAVEAT